ncbi:helix-turn-helix domain-containing protein [Bradyrhizobium sp. CCGUVB1N3]|uniref:helix-turn-helix domain-containing protein n=1 Tax=Bradyrhizobium sp. CCGUVB1N3 TaxID=2949629 RepID=UPI0020B3044D|nr:helix-turn-helix transcriptional regulator [Bradyrhizobium sp. CCGUVB1N3]MCP3474912.1 helix-turn-helix domain-containing protein [Bradyrhizobium sp. CCGUVB1N3]
MQTPDKQLTDEQSREVGEKIREELAKRRISRQALAEQAKLSLSTLEKVLGGRRPFTLATTVRLEQALGVSLRKNHAAPPAPAAGNDVAPDSLGSYSHRAVTWLEDVYITLRPSFGDKDALFAYRTEIAWEPKVSSLVFREGERTDAAYEHTGEVAVPHQSGFIYLVINRHGQHRVITVSRPTVAGEMYGIISTLRAGPGSQLTPIAAPIALVPARNVKTPTLGRIAPDNVNYALYRDHLRRTVDESFALFLPV